MSASSQPTPNEPLIKSYNLMWGVVPESDGFMTIKNHLGGKNFTPENAPKDVHNDTPKAEQKSDSKREDKRDLKREDKRDPKRENKREDKRDLKQDLRRENLRRQKAKEDQKKQAEREKISRKLYNDQKKKAYQEQKRKAYQDQKKAYRDQKRKAYQDQNGAYQDQKDLPAQKDLPVQKETPCERKENPCERKENPCDKKHDTNTWVDDKPKIGCHCEDLELEFCAKLSRSQVVENGIPGLVGESENPTWEEEDCRGCFAIQFDKCFTKACYKLSICDVQGEQLTVNLRLARAGENGPIIASIFGNNYGNYPKVSETDGQMVRLRPIQNTRLCVEGCLTNWDLRVVRDNWVPEKSQEEWCLNISTIAALYDAIRRGFVYVSVSSNSGKETVIPSCEILRGQIFAARTTA